MKAAILNANQKNNTLSAKKKEKNTNQASSPTKKAKKKVKSAGRPVLAESKSRFDNECELSQQQCTEFEENMLKYYQHKPVPVPKWSDLKKYSKEERKQVRKSEKVEIPSRTHIALGFNEVSRSLENKTAKIVVSAIAQPEKLLLKNIRQTCNIYNIPFLLIHNFRNISKRCFGFSSMMMAFKDVPSDTKIYEFYKFLQTFVSEHCKVDEPVEQAVPMEIEQPKRPIIEIEDPETSRDIYVYRSSTKRSFVPQPVKETKSFDADFISFDDKPTENTSQVPYPSSSNNRIGVLKNLRIKKLTWNMYRKQYQNN